MSTPNRLPVAVIYHAHCWDGLAAAWVVEQYCKQNLQCTPDWIEGLYQQEPDYKALAAYERIYIVDFSYPPDVLDTLAASSDIILIDHHKSAKEMLANYWPKPGANVLLVWDKAEEPKSGAVLAWDTLMGDYPPVPRPDFIKYIGDRDIWQWRYEGTKAFCAGLQLYEMTREGINEVADEFEQDIISKGQVILQVLDQQMDKLLPCTERIGVIHRDPESTATYHVPCVNAPSFLMSELLNILGKDEIFAVGWYKAGDIIKVSLRSDKNIPNAWDVSIIAKAYGGGGHANAAGFEIPVADWNYCIFYGEDSF